MNIALAAGVLLIIAEAYGMPGVAHTGSRKDAGAKPAVTTDAGKQTTDVATTEAPTPTCPKKGKDFQVQIKVTDGAEYSYDMTQVSSVAFQDVREKVYDCALQTYADYDYYQDLILISIENTTGGFIPNFAIRFTKEGDGHLNRLTQAINAGKFCDLSVAPKFVMCDELDQTLLYPYGNQECTPCTPACSSPCDSTVYVPVPPPPPPPPPAAASQCSQGCPVSCAPSCYPSCCFSAPGDWFNFKRQKMLKGTNPILPAAKKGAAKN